jgi:hypothetical protein
MFVVLKLKLCGIIHLQALKYLPLHTMGYRGGILNELHCM